MNKSNNKREISYNVDFGQIYHKGLESLKKSKKIEKLDHLLDLLLRYSFDLLQRERDRKSAIEKKAEILFTGLILGVLVAAGNLIRLVVQSSNFLNFQIYGSFVRILFYSSVIGTTVSFFYIIFQLLNNVLKPLTKYSTIDERDFFRWIGNGDFSNLTEYKWYLIIHFWRVLYNNKDTNEHKGKKLQLAYETTFYWLILFFLIGIFILLYL